MKLKKYLSIVFALFPFLYNSQISIQEYALKSFSFNDNDSVYNINTDCNSLSIGNFKSDSNILDFNNGLMLSTGTICSSIGPNSHKSVSSQMTSTKYTSYGIPSIYNSNYNLTIKENLSDLCLIEFDYFTGYDTLKINYQFGSEEYFDSTRTLNDDLFGVFICGPSFFIPKNITKVNDSNISISNINTVYNKDFFIDNSLKIKNIEFDGITKKLSTKEKINPWSTYHITILIADVEDQLYDSGVFIETVSDNFTHPIVSLEKCEGNDNPLEIDYSIINNHNLTLFPNPTENSFNIIFKDLNSNYKWFGDDNSLSSDIHAFEITFRLLDSSGNIIYSYLINDFLTSNGSFINTRKPIDISELKKGLYFVEIQKTYSGVFGKDQVNIEHYKLIKK